MNHMKRAKDEVPKLVTERQRYKQYDWNEIQRHCQPDDLWVVVGGMVFDVTKYQQEHPGGKELMLEHGGRDATNAFNQAIHPQSVRSIMQQHQIGETADKYFTMQLGFTLMILAIVLYSFFYILYRQPKPSIRIDL